MTKIDRFYEQLEPEKSPSGVRIGKYGPYNVKQLPDQKKIRFDKLLTRK